ncbi:MAG: hypothetical protein PHV74_10280 [Dehalococcoidia bacterium]|nr:hypothetical protein [Dehalococcoidia bacterium]
MDLREQCIEFGVRYAYRRGYVFALCCIYEQPDEKVVTVPDRFSTLLEALDRYTGPIDNRHLPDRHLPAPTLRGSVDVPLIEGEPGIRKAFGLGFRCGFSDNFGRSIPSDHTVILDSVQHWVDDPSDNTPIDPLYIMAEPKEDGQAAFSFVIQNPQP